MKRNFYLYVLLLIGAAVLTKFKIGFVSAMIFYMMIIVPFVEIGLMLMAYFTFHISHELNKRIVVKGEEVVYQLNLVNPTPFVFCPIKIYFTGSELIFDQDDLQKDNQIILYPFHREEIKRHLKCHYRGSYYVGVERIEFHGFFGMFVFDYTNIETHKILVHPKIHELKAYKIPLAVSESSESLISFDETNKSVFSELRAYRPGDSLNKIHWKASVKKNEWVTKEYEGNVNNRTKIIINNELLPWHYEENIVVEDYLIEGCVALTNYLLENNTPTELFWTHLERATLKGDHASDFRSFYDLLATLNYDGQKESSERLIQEAAHSYYDQCVLYYFTPTLDFKTSEMLLNKKKQGYTVNIVTLPIVGLNLNGHHITFDAKPIYHLMDQGITVYHVIFEDGQCRLEVA